jgi:hypothetical protein
MGIRYRLNTTSDMDNLRRDARQAILMGKPLVLEVVTDSKTDRQRAYQFGWFYDRAVIALEEAGIEIPLKDGGSYPYDVQILHEVLKKHCLRPLYLKWGKRESITAENGSKLELPVSTEKDNDGKRITTKEFSEYIKKCREFLWVWKQISVPEPEDGYYASIAKELGIAV